MKRNRSGRLSHTMRWGHLCVAMFVAASCGESNSPVQPSTTPPAPTTTSVSVSGSAPLVGSASSFTATATLSNGTTQNVTTQATWESSNVGVATVAAGGSVTGVGAGEADIRAIYQGVTGTTRIMVVVPPMPPPPADTGVVINEFRVRGPNGANDEFIELRNDSPKDVDISGWRIDGSDSSGTVITRRILVEAGIVLQPGCHFLLTNSNTDGYRGSVAGDETYGVGITNDGGIAVRRPNGTIVDQVGMSDGSAFREGTRLDPFGSALTDRSYKRKGIDTDNNAADFVLNAPSTPINRAGSCTARLQ